MDCTVTVPGRLKAKKGVNTPDVILEMSPITEKEPRSRCSYMQVNLKMRGCMCFW